MYILLATVRASAVTVEAEVSDRYHW